MPKTADEWLAKADEAVYSRGNVSIEEDLLQLQAAVRRATTAWDTSSGEATKSNLAIAASIAIRCLRSGDVMKLHEHVYRMVSSNESPTALVWRCSSCGVSNPVA